MPKFSLVKAELTNAIAIGCTCVFTTAFVLYKPGTKIPPPLPTGGSSINSSN